MSIKDKELIIVMYNYGYTTGEIAKELDISESEIVKIVRPNGLGGIVMNTMFKFGLITTLYLGTTVASALLMAKGYDKAVEKFCVEEDTEEE